MENFLRVIGEGGIFGDEGGFRENLEVCLV